MPVRSTVSSLPEIHNLPCRNKTRQRDCGTRQSLCRVYAHGKVDTAKIASAKTFAVYFLHRARRNLLSCAIQPRTGKKTPLSCAIPDARRTHSGTFAVREYTGLTAKTNCWLCVVEKHTAKREDKIKKSPCWRRGHAILVAGTGA